MQFRWECFWQTRYSDSARTVSRSCRAVTRLRWCGTCVPDPTCRRLRARQPTSTQWSTTRVETPSPRDPTTPRWESRERERERERERDIYIYISSLFSYPSDLQLTPTCPASVDCLTCAPTGRWPVTPKTASSSAWTLSISPWAGDFCSPATTTTRWTSGTRSRCSASRCFTGMTTASPASRWARTAPPSAPAAGTSRSRWAVGSRCYSVIQNYN